MPTHPDDQTGPLGARHRLAHRLHVRTGQAELIRIQNRFIAELQSVQAGLAEGLGSGRTRSHDPGRPPVVPAQFQPGRDGLRPVPRITHRVAAGQADPDLDAVGDGGEPVRREDHRLVPAGREVPQRVILAVDLQQTPDRGFVLTGECVLGTLRLEEHHCSGHQCQRAEETEQRVEDAVRLSDEQVGCGGDESTDPVDGVGEPIFGLQRAGKKLQQSPCQRDAQQVAGHQDGSGLDQCAAAHLRGELAPGQHQYGDGGDMERQTQGFADIFQRASVPPDQRCDIEPDRDHQVDHQHPPGDALARRQCPGHDGQRESPGEAGVGEVEQVVVDELPRHPGEVTDRRRDTGQQRGGRDHAEERARRRGNPTEAGPGGSGPGPAHRDRHRPPGYSLITSAAPRLTRGSRCTSRPGLNPAHQAPRWPPGRPAAGSVTRP